MVICTPENVCFFTWYTFRSLKRFLILGYFIVNFVVHIRKLVVIYIPHNCILFHIDNLVCYTSIVWVYLESLFEKIRI